jgi:uncharacterized repeat protein (TIGR03803 family)
MIKAMKNHFDKRSARLLPFLALAWLATSASAQHLTTLATFNKTNGAYPQGSLESRSSTEFWGTTVSGGTNNYGTIFRVKSGTLNSMYSFSGTNGRNPYAGPGVRNYGTTFAGGSNGYGTAFSMASDGVLTTLYSFTNGVDGANPQASLVESGIEWYGTSSAGGTNGYGTVFNLFGNHLRPLYSFTSGPDGATPLGGLVVGHDGNLYGTTSAGGSNGFGTVFKITTSGVLTPLHSFAYASDGAKPLAGLVQGQGHDYNLYGTTSEGGAYGHGTVFMIALSGALTTLYSFAGGADGGNPQAGLVLGGQTSDSNLYGTTSQGGNGWGTLFRISTNGTLVTLYSFGEVTDSHGHPLDGGSPKATLLSGKYWIWGTTSSGGSNNHGTVFQLDLLPTFVAQPQSQISNEGETVTLSATATNVFPITYRWRRNGVALSDGGNISGSTSNILTLSSISGKDAGTYTLYANNFYGTTLSSNAFLTVFSRPAGRVVWAGCNVTLMGAFGAGPNSYQWRLNGTNLPNGVIATAAGGGIGGDGAPAVAASLDCPTGVAVDALGNLFITDAYDCRIRIVDTNGIITTLAGDGTAGFSGDGGPASHARLFWPSSVAVDASGNLFIADQYNHRIRQVSTSGVITTVAGNGTAGYSGDGGTATHAGLGEPFGLAVDTSGNLFIADEYNHCIRQVDANGYIWTVAGNGTAGYSGDGGTATNASLSSPRGVLVQQSSGNLFIADTDNQCIREVFLSLPYNIQITTVAGNGTAGYSGDGGPATSASMDNPSGFAVDTSGNFFISDEYNNCIRQVDANGYIWTVAGNGTAGYSGDGDAATNASLNYPMGVAVDGWGNLFIAD